jgi:heat shock protein HtpX
MNTAKTAILMIALTVLFVGVGGVIAGQQGLVIALVMAVAMNFFSYWFSDKVVLRMYRAREVSESEAPELYGVVRDLAMRASIPMPRVYLIPSDAPNAFATGRNPEHAAVAATTGIIQLLSREELAGVMAHELSHVRNRDILIGTIAATIAGAISMLFYVAMFFGGGDRENRGPIPLLLMLILAPIAAGLIQMAVSRSREFQADQSGAELSGSPLSLASALRRLESASRRVTMNANPATAHMFIVNPLRGGGVTKLFSTHPPMEERIARLEQMAMGAIR